MAKHCSVCLSSDFRLSRVRSGDILRLVLLMYPVRCQECFRRDTVFLPKALLYRKSIAAEHSAKPQKA
jgi:hypothetical protein